MYLKKYKHTYSLELMEKNVREAYYAMFQIDARYLGANQRKQSIFTVLRVN